MGEIALLLDESDQKVKNRPLYGKETRYNNKYDRINGGLIILLICFSIFI